MTTGLALTLGLLACLQVPTEGVELRLRGPDTAVELGRAFELVVTRVWPKTLVPEPWSDESLAPLVLRRGTSKRRDLGARIEETLRFDAYAFARDSLVVPGPTFTASCAGVVRTVSGNDLRLSIRSALGSEDATEAELPRAPFGAPVSPLVLVLVTGLLVALSAIAWSRYRRREPLVVSEPDPCWILALRRLERARARVPDSFEDHRDDAVLVSRIVRDYLLARFGIAARELTTEQLLEDPRTAHALDESQRELLGELLAHCDRVKFARDEQAANARDTRIVRARELIVTTEPREPEAGVR